MKSLFYKIVVLLVSVYLYACSSADCKDESTFYVRGNCEMCKERIEEALNASVGVCNASWDVTSKMATVKYDATKTNLNTLLKSCADVGHDTEVIKSADAVHDQLPECCQRKAKPM